MDPTFAGVGFGAECEFLGFSYGGGWKAQMNKGWVWLPYFNLCTVSALVTESDIKIWVLDGINNEGFSGAPSFFSRDQHRRFSQSSRGMTRRVWKCSPLLPQVQPTLDNYQPLLCCRGKLENKL